MGSNPNVPIQLSGRKGVHKTVSTLSGGCAHGMGNRVARLQAALTLSRSARAKRRGRLRPERVGKLALVRHVGPATASLGASGTEKSCEASGPEEGEDMRIAILMVVLFWMMLATGCTVLRTEVSTEGFSPTVSAAIHRAMDGAKRCSDGVRSQKRSAEVTARTHPEFSRYRSGYPERVTTIQTKEETVCN